MKKFTKMLLAAAMALSFTACSSNDTEETVINIQFVPTNVESADATTQEFEAYLENILEVDVNVTVATNYNTIVEAMKSGQVDVGIMPPVAYVQARGQNAATSILSSTLVDYDQVTELPVEGSTVGTFKAEVVVKAGSGISSYKDLEGKTIAHLGESSASGYVYPVAEMKAAGVDMESITFTTITDIPSAMAAVYRGEVDAAFVFEGARYVFQNAVKDNEGNPVDVWENLAVAKLSDGDIPNDAIAVLPTMDEALKTAIQEAFLTMAADEEGKAIMSAWGHTGYVVSDEKAYDTIESYIAAAADEE